MKDNFLILIVALIFIANFFLTIKIYNLLKSISGTFLNRNYNVKDDKESSKPVKVQKEDFKNHLREKTLKSKDNSTSHSLKTHEQHYKEGIHGVSTSKQEWTTNITAKQKVIKDEVIGDSDLSTEEGVALKWWNKNLEILENCLEDSQKISKLENELSDISNLEFKNGQNMVYISIREFKDKDLRIVAPLLYAPLKGNFKYFEGASITGQVEKIIKPAILKELDKEMSYFSIISKGEIECG